MEPVPNPTSQPKANSTRWTCSFNCVRRNTCKCLTTFFGLFFSAGLFVVLMVVISFVIKYKYPELPRLVSGNLEALVKALKKNQKK